MFFGVCFGLKELCKEYPIWGVGLKGVETTSTLRGYSVHPPCWGYIHFAYKYTVGVFAIDNSIVVIEKPILHEKLNVAIPRQ